MNKVIEMGRLTKAPEYRIAQNDREVSYCKYYLAVKTKNRKSDGKDVNFIPCVCFGNNADWAHKYLKKGKEILVTGHLDVSVYQTKDGKTAYSTSVIVEEHDFTGAPDPSGRGAIVDNGVTTEQDGFMKLPDNAEEEVPFD